MQHRTYERHDHHAHHPARTAAWLTIVAMVTLFLASDTQLPASVHWPVAIVLLVVAAFIAFFDRVRPLMTSSAVRSRVATTHGRMVSQRIRPVRDSRGPTRRSRG